MHGPFYEGITVRQIYIVPQRVRACAIKEKGRVRAHESSTYANCFHCNTLINLIDRRERKHRNCKAALMKNVVSPEK